VSWRRLALPMAGVAAVLVGVLVFGNLNDNLVYYLTPGEAMARRADFPEGRRLRVGGLVKAGSVTQAPGRVSFAVTDGTRTVRVVHTGAPAQLFREGVGVVVEGTWSGSEFWSDTMLVKHDENYRPPGAAETGAGDAR
jgi:cytochrome c-type biogenesis protein CcmE